MFKIGNIENPVDELTTDRFRVNVYDSHHKIIIQSSFEFLDPFNFTYSYNGPLIIVNDGKDIMVERGTETEDLYITT